MPDILTRVVGRRDRLAALLLAESAGGFDGAAAGRVTDAALAFLPTGVRYDTLYRSLVAVFGDRLAPDRAKEVAWAIAGNTQTLRAGVPAYPPTLPQKATPAAIQVVAVRRMDQGKKRRTPTPGDGFRVRLRLRVLYGAACPTVFEVTWGSKFVAFVAGRVLGFTKPARPGRQTQAPSIGRPYQHYSTTTGLRFSADLTAGPDGKPALTNLRCGPSFKAHNRALTEMRWRATFACPFAFTHPCHQCPKGQASCPAACRPLDLIPLPCPRCRDRGAADPTWSRLACVHCGQFA